jgi:hypothetical protein
MPIAVQCSGCGGRFRAPDEAAGKRVKCPKCSALIEVSPTERYEAAQTGDSQTTGSPQSNQQKPRARRVKFIYPIAKAAHLNRRFSWMGASDGTLICEPDHLVLVGRFCGEWMARNKVKFIACCVGGVLIGELVSILFLNMTFGGIPGGLLGGLFGGVYQWIALRQVAVEERVIPNTGKVIYDEDQSRIAIQGPKDEWFAIVVGSTMSFDAILRDLKMIFSSGIIADSLGAGTVSKARRKAGLVVLIIFAAIMTFVLSVVIAQLVLGVKF